VLLQVNPSVEGVWNLSWESSLNQNAQIDIYRNERSIGWEVIGSVLSSNTSFTDISAPLTSICYQISVSNGPQCAIISNIICNNISGLTNSVDGIEFFPNPSNNKISFYSLYSGDYEILNHLGVLFERGTCEIGLNTIDLTNTPTGSYILKIYSSNEVSVGKLIKN
jgi:hypothetical protein